MSDPHDYSAEPSMSQLELGKALRDTYMSPEHGWTCFHCGATFMHEQAARTHFGAKPTATPGCVLRMQDGERPLLRMVRSLEAEIAELRAALDCLQASPRTKYSLGSQKHSGE